MPILEATEVGVYGNRSVIDLKNFQSIDQGYQIPLLSKAGLTIACLSLS